MPSPGATAWYSISLEERPDLLSVDALYAATWPSRDYRFTSLDAEAGIEVHVDGVTITATCTAGCSLA